MNPLTYRPANENDYVEMSFIGLRPVDLFAAVILHQRLKNTDSSYDEDIKVAAEEAGKLASRMKSIYTEYDL